MSTQAMTVLAFQHKTSVFEGEILSSNGTFHSWLPGQPNNYAGKQDCVADGENMNDMDCETQYNALCQVKLFTLFQLEGFCDNGISDHNFIMSEV